uniref:Alkyl transferase n=1 Tax=Lepeophtheirus salmonis TaxID=72036 RepID=C1BSP2_LEPSM|nr:dehydrodolichyl diphosphate synthase complex subunit DHDDS-like [Lepeophtheirus salmonis]ACO12045.1 Dehydrodolichyl diphosphate synthase [Lepeophtheirus salmonis]
MSWIPEEGKTPVYSWWERLLLSILRTGSLPRHVAFIMDGNRRFARKSKVELIKGHSSGFDKLSETLFWCRDLGIEEVSVYAFSIENFKRPQHEVNDLLDLARSKFQKLFSEIHRLAEKGVRVQVIGNLALLPEDLQEVIRKCVESTKDHSKCTLNVAFAYTSRDELTTAIRSAVESEKDSSAHIEPKTLENHFYGKGRSQVDLIIRTSGEVRLSDFMLWQGSYAVTYFTKVLWPEFRLLNLMAGIFHYQHNYPYIQALAPKEELK